MAYWLHGAILLPDFSVLLEKLIISQVVKIFLLSLYGTRMLCTVSTRARHLSLAWTRRIQSTLFVAIHFKIIFPYTPVCYKLSPSFRFPYQNSVLIYFLSLRASCPAILFLHFCITRHSEREIGMPKFWCCVLLSNILFIYRVIKRWGGSLYKGWKRLWTQ